VRHFIEELEQLKIKLLEMGSLVEAAIQKTIHACVDKDRNAAREVFEREARINAIELEIDDLAINLLALHQPMAADLRFIIAALKINTNLERMGDLSVTIAHNAISQMEKPASEPMIDIRYIAELVQPMVRKSLDAFVSGDVELARSVLSDDDAVDNLRTACDHALVDFMEKDRRNIPQALNLLNIIRSLERIADHSTNIAEEVLFHVTGIDVRQNTEPRRDRDSRRKRGYGTNT
jgi:phosphate transport system protein